jgi:hypothetical protein
MLLILMVRIVENVVRTKKSAAGRCGWRQLWRPVGAAVLLYTHAGNAMRAMIGRPITFTSLVLVGVIIWLLAGEPRKAASGEETARGGPAKLLKQLIKKLRRQLRRAKFFFLSLRTRVREWLEEDDV